ncbi:hypothetical protein predicted by Glimmer/Critica (plasmid) [Sinorhizobium fredii HH103]|uniref:Uncharacterized protein n=1 Tax=Sinorhizobium fredii (strain HH103) TaxID=1117943 RepID=G9AG71_SINF1|nr:hypothetical protein predicted by Glimmer/Critica [Sinorhizobium fredii HH103]
MPCHVIAKAKMDSYVDAPYGKGFLSGGLIGCFHMSGLFVRYEV